MNKLQLFRYQMAQLGFEYTIEETKDLVFIAKKLVQLAKLPEQELRSRCNLEDSKQRILFETVMEIKRKRRKRKQ